MRTIKILTIGFITLLPAISFAQYNNGFFDHTFFSRLPSARAEAMGKAYSSIDGDLSTIFFNPAGTTTIKGIEAYTSNASPYYFSNTATFSFLSIGYKINDFLILALSRNYYTDNEVGIWQDSNLKPLGSFLPYNSNYCLTISSQPLKNLFLGLNTNLFTCYLGQDKKPYALYFDFGIIKKFQFLKKENSNQSINLGSSITNFNYSKLTSYFNGYKFVQELPVITRYGANYQFNLNKHLLFDSLETFRLLVQGEYQMLLNSDYHSGVHFGGELMLLEILSLRIGYYNEKEYDGFIPEKNVNIRSFTYGFGLQFPIYKFTKAPLNISFDFTSLPQPTGPNSTWDFDNFTSFNLRLNWIIKSKKNKSETLSIN